MRILLLFLNLFLVQEGDGEVEDEVVSKLMDKAKRRKGRGFTGGRGEDRDEVCQFGRYLVGVNRISYLYFLTVYMVFL